MEALPTYVRLVPLLGYVSHTPHALATKICLLPGPTSLDQGPAPPVGGHVPQRRPPEPVTRLLLRHLLPDRPHPAHPHGGPDELCPLQGHPPA